MNISGDFLRIGLVLSGGMAKGAYQVGALKAVSNYLPPSHFSYFSCSSVGVLNGYSYAVDTLDKAEFLWKSLCNNNNRILINELLRSSLLQEKVESITKCEKTITCPFYCTLADFGGKRVVYKDLSKVELTEIPLFLKASVAMPVYNKGVRIDGRLYFDGAMLDNIPVYPLQTKGLDYIICVYFDNTSYCFETALFDSRVIKVQIPAENAFRQSLVFREESIREMIQRGYDYTAFILDSVFSKGTSNLDAIYSKIAENNKHHGKSTLRVTGDMLVTNLNKAAKRFVKQKIT